MTKQEAVDAIRAEMRVGGRPVKRTLELTRMLAQDGVTMPTSVTSEVFANLEERLVRAERLLAGRKGNRAVANRDAVGDGAAA